jgi:hypothetical protein
MKKVKNFILILMLMFSISILTGCAPKEVKEFLNSDIYAEELEGYLEMTVYDGDKFYDLKYISHSDKVTITGNTKAKVIPSIEATEAPITIEVYDGKKCIASKDTVLKIYPAQHYAADIIVRGWKTNRKENYIYYYHKESGKYGNNVVAGETIDVKFYFDTMLLHFELSSYSKNTSTGEEHNTYWKLYYSPVEHKLYDDLGNYLYTDRVNTTDIIPDGTSRFLTHIDAIDRYFRYIKADEYLSGLKSTKVEDLFQ